MKTKSILSSLFVIGSFFAATPTLAHSEQNKTLPPAILAFQKMDFDTRMIHLEFLRLKSGQTLFIDTIRQSLSPSNHEEWDERISQSLAVVYLGRPTETLNPTQRLSVVTAACGLKRLSQFIQFYEANPKPSSYFLDDKDPLYRTALSAESHAFDEAGLLFSVDDVVALKTHLMQEEWRFDTQHPFSGNPYKNYISEQAKQKLNLLQKTHLSHTY